MIKVTHKGFDIQFDSVSQLNEFINHKTLKYHPMKDKNVSEIATLPSKKRKYTVRNIWLVKEVEEITRMIGMRHSDAEIARSSYLRARHSKGAIRQMTDKVRSGNNLQSTSKEVKALIESYRGTSVPVRVA